MRAVESFDVHKGNRFSTYATLALMKGFARSVPMLLSDRSGTKGAIRRESLDVELADRRSSPIGGALIERDELRKLMSLLQPRERTILLAHYGLREREREIASEHVIPATHEQLGERFGVSVQRIRQIERAAIEKLRASVQ
jgi:RNA polymerase sigma factor (sigma-70 family)